MITAFVTAASPAALPPLPALVIRVGQDFLLAGGVMVLALGAGWLASRTRGRQRTLSPTLRVSTRARGASARHAA